MGNISEILNIPRPAADNSLDFNFNQFALTKDTFWGKVQKLQRSGDPYDAKVFKKLEKLKDELSLVSLDENYDRFGSYYPRNLDIKAVIEAQIKLIEGYVAHRDTLKLDEVDYENIEKTNKIILKLEKLAIKQRALQNIAIELEFALNEIDLDYDYDVFWSQYISEDSTLPLEIDVYTPAHTLSILIDQVFIEKGRGRDLYNFANFLIASYETISDSEETRSRQHPNSILKAKEQIVKAKCVLQELEVQLIIEELLQ